MWSVQQVLLLDIFNVAYSHKMAAQLWQQTLRSQDSRGQPMDHYDPTSFSIFSLIWRSLTDSLSLYSFGMTR